MDFITFDLHRYGVMYLIAPQVNFFHGPVDVPHYLQHKLHGPTIPELAELEIRRIGWTVLSKRAKEQKGEHSSWTQVVVHIGAIRLLIDKI